jgi:hypothetical protein
MTWINTILAKDSSGPLRRAYEEVYALYPPEYQITVEAVQRADGESDSVVAAHSLIPDAMKHIMSTLGVLMQPDLPLTRRQHEMIATVVSARNRCFY